MTYSDISADACTNTSADMSDNVPADASAAAFTGMIYVSALADASADASGDIFCACALPG